MATGPADRFTTEAFARALNRHLRKAVEKVVVDLGEVTRHQAQEARKVIETLSNKDQGRIVILN